VLTNKNKKVFKAKPYLAVILLLIVSLLQVIGFFWPLELEAIHGLRSLLPNFLPEAPPVVLVSIQSTPQGFASMDAAMVLRGLGELHPRCVAVEGTIAPERGSVSFLPDILSRLGESGIRVIIPQSPTSKNEMAAYEIVPLTHYSLTPVRTNWPRIPGKSIPAKGDAFLPENSNSSVNLTLFASATDDSTIGSVWWWSLPTELRKNIFLLFGRVLLLGNNTPLYLNTSGEIASRSLESVKEIPLDDFLLQIERREQGILSPSFDSLWVNSTVIVATHDDLPHASAFAVFVEATSYQHFSPWVQFIFMSGWIILFILICKFRHHFPEIPVWLVPLIIIIALLAVTLLMLHFGIIIPLMPGLTTALLLLLT